MGSSQSVPSTPEITYSPSHVSNVKEYKASTKNGPKAQTLEETNLISVIAEESDSSMMSAESDYSSDEDEDFEFDSNEEDEEAAERRMILEEARQLKEMAGFYLHPEAPVASDAMACARCYFSRYSAPVASEDESEDEAERKLILADAKNLKELAGFYMHPEKPVVSTDANACGRNFFSRPSAPELEDEDEEEERELILEEMKQLKTVAEWYLNPEKPVVADATACGRNFFTRPSAPLNEEEMERELILEEMNQLKTTAGWYLKPEQPVAVDATASGRNYFTRPSAPVSEDEEERELILQEMKELKTTADWYLHPEKPVAVDSAVCGRNYFTRPSAPEYEDEEDDIDAERERVLEDMKALKTVAQWYLHPEKPVSVDPTACGRNYFTRPSAPADDVDTEEQERILEEMKELKTTAEWYLNPEKPVTVDSNACGRNYFSRPSAPADDVDTEEQERILEDLKQLKMTAEWYMHPEKPVAVDPSSFGRSYFTRPSAPECDNDVEEERESIMEDLKKLKTTAEWYMHPEKPVSVDATACGRNYFTRPSAPECDDDEEEERDRIMEDLKQLKTTAEWYMHPEKPVSVDATACGRNYFTRPSAMDDDAGALSWENSNGKHLSLDFESNYTDEMEEERKRVLAEASQLKEVASWYLEPEKPIKVDPAVFGRNYFSRPSAPEQEGEDDIDERELILADLNELKRVADWYMHPEKEVTVYATACGRNFFTRPSAPEYEEEEDMEEQEKILADAAELLRVAEWYMHPEKPVTVYSTACGRNFFSRPSAPECDDEDMEDERQRILAEAKDLKEVAGWYLNPEQPVKTNGFATARNYFSRPSAPEYDNEEREQVLADAQKLKEVAEWYLKPEKSISVDPTACGRNYFTRPSAPAYNDEDVEEERDQVLAEAKQLKEVASWYLEPEKPVTVDPTAYGRNYFSRPSAEGSSESPDEEKNRILADAMELKKNAIDYLHPERPVASSSINCARNYFGRPSAKGHLDNIHTQGHANNSPIHSDYVHHVYDYHHHDHHDHHYDYHHDDISHQSFQSQSDHFEMEEDVFHGFRESISAFHESVVGVHDPEHIPIIKEEDGKEGNLSRSPSSIMLFDEQAAM